MANTPVQKSLERAGQIQPEATQSVYFTPRVDILETDNEILLFADMPGVRPEDADVRFENGELILHGHCAQRHEGVNYLAAEYGVGDFYRVFTISADIDAGKIAAELKNGVLTIQLPKSEAVKPKKIAVK
jgi:HSP20 family molecular chaperone IbpA